MTTETAKSWRDLGKRMAKAVERAGPQLFDAIEESLDDLGVRWVQKMEARTRGQFSPNPKSRTDPLAVRSGGLRRSFGHRVLRPSPTEIVARFFNTKAYALIHELGTEGAGGELPDIVPKRAGALTIPMEAALTASGRPKGGKAKASQWDDLFVFSFPVFGDRDQGYLARETGTGDIELVFRLQQVVAIPPRLGGRDTLRELMDSSLLPRLNRVLDEKLKG